jgi:tetratricopeptide (TPR) repeat protein
LALEVKQFDVARKCFEPAIAQEPSKAAEVLLTWGLELFLANQYADAAKVFQRGIDDAVLPADNPAFYFYLAGALEMDGKTDAAIEAAQKAADKQKDNPRFQSRSAWILYHAKRYQDAEKAYKALLEKFEPVRDNSEVRDVLREARLVLSNIAVLDNRMPTAEEWLEQVLDEFPDDTGALNDLGYLWADQDKHVERALRMVQAAVAAEPKNMAYRDSLGWAYYRLGRYAEAVAELKTAAAVDEPDGVILDHLGDAQYKAGDTAAAVASWKRAVEALEKAKDVDKAKVVAEKIVKSK